MINIKEDVLQVNDLSLYADEYEYLDGYKDVIVARYSDMSDNEIMLIAVYDNKCVASIIIDMRTKEISSVYTDDEYRNIGMASKLLNVAIKKYHMKYIDVYSNNAVALRLYTRIGFHIDSTSDDGALIHMSI